MRNNKINLAQQIVSQFNQSINKVKKKHDSTELCAIMSNNDSAVYKKEKKSIQGNSVGERVMACNNKLAAAKKCMPMPGTGKAKVF